MNPTMNKLCEIHDKTMGLTLTEIIERYFVIETQIRKKNPEMEELSVRNKAYSQIEQYYKSKGYLK